MNTTTTWENTTSFTTTDPGNWAFNKKPKEQITPPVRILDVLLIDLSPPEPANELPDELLCPNKWPNYVTTKSNAQVTEDVMMWADANRDIIDARRAAMNFTKPFKPEHLKVAIYEKGRLLRKTK